MDPHDILMQKLDLNDLSKQLHEELKKTNSKQKIKDLTKRLKLAESIRTSGRHGEPGGHDESANRSCAVTGEGPSSMIRVSAPGAL